MALFSSTTAWLGLDVGTSALKLVELIDRRKRIEVTTYGQANMPNLLVDPHRTNEEAIQEVATIVTQLIERSGVTTDNVVAALPNSIVFSTVLELPDLPEAEMDKAVHFAARDVVPANLDEMILGWSRLGVPPHMDTIATAPAAAQKPAARPSVAAVPVFLTAAPRTIVERYTRLIETLHLRLAALEVETFPLARSLLSSPTDSALLVDFGDQVTTVHIIEHGTAQVSHTVETGGNAITAALAQALGTPAAEAEYQKTTVGLSAGASAVMHNAIEASMMILAKQVQRVLAGYEQKTQRRLSKTILIGGGANMPGLPAWWSKTVGIPAAIGNPWRGLTYPQSLESRLSELGPRYAVAVGLALRGFNK